MDISTESIIKSKAPKARQWVRQPLPDNFFNFGYPAARWCHPQGFIVISALEVAKDDGPDLGPEYHISVSKDGGRCTGNEAKWVCKQFDMETADEDNHVPGGFVRNFWKPVAEKHIGHVCPCKDSEPAIKENKGDFIWRGVPQL